MSNHRANQPDRMEKRSKTKKPDEIEQEEVVRQIRHKMAQLMEREREEALRATENVAKTETDTIATILPEIHSMRRRPNESIRKAMKIVPRFDGKNMPVYSFIRACRRAREMMPSTSEPTVTKLMINKLHGAAYRAVEGHTVQTIDSLCNRLRQIFGSHHTHEHYRSELRNILMRNNESMIEYINRVKDLYQALLNEERNSQEITKIKQDEIDEFALRSFCDGLPLDYHRLITISTCRDLTDAYDQALELYAKMEYEKERRRDLLSPRKPRPETRQNIRDRRTTDSSETLQK